MNYEQLHLNRPAGDGLHCGRLHFFCMSPKTSRASMSKGRSAVIGVMPDVGLSLAYPTLAIDRWGASSLDCGYPVGDLSFG